MNKLFLVFFVTIYPDIIFGENCNIVSRQQWNAKSPSGDQNVLSQHPAPYVIVHHSETPPCNSVEACKARIKNIQEYHMGHNRWADIGYNFLIGTEGTIFEGRGWDIGGAHAPKYNSRSMGICLIGSYQNVSPPEVQMSALKSLIECGVGLGKIKSNYSLAGHRQVTATTCPGDKLYEILTHMDNFILHPN